MANYQEAFSEEWDPGSLLRDDDDSGGGFFLASSSLDEYVEEEEEEQEAQLVIDEDWQTPLSPTAAASAAEQLPRPPAAPGRPFTRRANDPALIPGSARQKSRQRTAWRQPAPEAAGPGPAPGGRREGSAGRRKGGGGGAAPPGARIVYVDHHHVHHHHHFHPPAAWGGAPGDVPPEAERGALERHAQQDVEDHAQRAAQRRNAAAAAGKPRNRAAAGGGRGSMPAPRKAWAATGAVGPQRVGTAVGRGPPRQRAVLDVDADVTAEELMPRDADWPAGSTICFNRSSGPSPPGTAGRNAGKGLLPLSDYLGLISQLSPQSRLKFSPYSVPQSARGLMR